MTHVEEVNHFRTVKREKQGKQSVIYWLFCKDQTKTEQHVLGAEWSQAATCTLSLLGTIDKKKMLARSMDTSP